VLSSINVDDVVQALNHPLQVPGAADSDP